MRHLFCFLVFIIVASSTMGQNQIIWSESWEGNWLTNWHVSSGTWQVGAPASGPNNSFAGSNCAATVLNGNYAEPVDSRLIRHTTFTVPPATANPRLRFWHWYSFSDADYGRVQIKTSQGVWENISPQYTSTGSNVWTYPSIDLSAYADSVIEIAFFFHSQIVGGQSDVSSGWYIDNVELVTGSIGFSGFEGFETGIGDWNSERGTWEIGIPSGSAYQGSQCAATVLNGNYREPVDSRLISPAFLVSSANNNPRLRFWHWYSFSDADYGRVQIRTSQGVWENISPQYTSTGSNVWTYPSIDLSAYADSVIEIAFFFHSQIVGGQSDVSSGWYIDNVELVTGSLSVLNPETFEAGIANWFAEKGTWEVGVPTSGPNSAHGGTQCAATVLNGNYREPVDSRLVSPPFLVKSASENPALQFWHWYSFSDADYGQIQIKTPNTNWVTISNSFTNTSSGVWSPGYISLAAYADSIVQIALLFHSQTVGGQSDVSSGWYVDDIQIPTNATTLLIFPNYGGNQGKVTTTIYGSNFSPQSQVKLSRSGFSDIQPPDSSIHVIDSSTMLVSFDLNGQAIGDWDVNVYDSTTNQIQTLINGFEIQDQIDPSPWIEIIGFDVIRPDRWQTYTITYGNNGNVDAKGVPLWIAIPPNTEIDFDWDVLKPDTLFDYDTIDQYVHVDTINGNPFDANVYGFIIPQIYPNSVGSLTFKLKTNSNNNFKIAAWVGLPLYINPLKEQVADCLKTLLEEVIGLIPGIDIVACLYGFFDNANGILFEVPILPRPNPSLGSIFWNSWTTFFPCANVILGETVFPVLEIIITGINVSRDCLPLAPSFYKEFPISPVNSYDPNDKLGAKGSGAANYLSTYGPYQYQIRFENVDTANAPAQSVVIVDTLAEDIFDVSSVQLGVIRFGDSIVNILSGVQSLTKEIDLRPSKNIILRIDAQLDRANSTIRWDFSSLDPATMLPTLNPLDGFLPPNINSPEGEGSVFFTVSAKSSLANNTSIKNKAYITFDNNPPIITPTWINTLDKEPPTSQVNALAQIQNYSSFNVSWGGSDAESGLLDYTIFVAEGDAEYLPWLVNTTNTSSIFTGQNDSVYRFYSIARDSVLNYEIAPLNFDVSTMVATSIYDREKLPKDVHVFPNPSRGVFNVKIELAYSEEIEIVVYNINGQQIYEDHYRIGSGITQKYFDISDQPPGIYFINIILGSDFFSRKIHINN